MKFRSFRRKRSVERQKQIKTESLIEDPMEERRKALLDLRAECAKIRHYAIQGNIDQIIESADHIRELSKEHDFSIADDVLDLIDQHMTKMKGIFARTMVGFWLSAAVITEATLRNQKSIVLFGALFAAYSFLGNMYIERKTTKKTLYELEETLRNKKV